MIVLYVSGVQEMGQVPEDTGCHSGFKRRDSATRTLIFLIRQDRTVSFVQGCVSCQHGGIQNAQCDAAGRGGAQPVATRPLKDRPLSLCVRETLLRELSIATRPSPASSGTYGLRSYCVHTCEGGHRDLLKADRLTLRGSQVSVQSTKPRGQSLSQTPEGILPRGAVPSERCPPLPLHASPASLCEAGGSRRGRWLGGAPASPPRADAVTPGERPPCQAWTWPPVKWGESRTAPRVIVQLQGGHRGQGPAQRWPAVALRVAGLAHPHS